MPRVEAQRAATSLELMFDLAAVIAIATAAVGLEYAIVSSYFAEGIVGFLAEMALPVIADRKSGLSWHRHHMIERFGFGYNLSALGAVLFGGAAFTS